MTTHCPTDDRRHGGDPTELTRRMQKVWIVKRATLPTGQLRTGRVFKDPQGLNAADLVITLTFLPGMSPASMSAFCG